MIARALLATSVMWLASAAMSAAAHQPSAAHLPEDERAALERGEIVTKYEVSQGDAARSARARAMGVIAGPPARILDVLTDFESWSEFLPNQGEIGILERGEGRVRLQSELRVLFVSLQHTLVYTVEPEVGRLSWIIDSEASNDIDWVEGSWQVWPLGDGASSLVEFALQVDVGRFVPVFIQNRLLRSSLPDVVESLREEVRRRASESSPFRGDGRCPPRAFEACTVHQPIRAGLRKSA